MLKLEKSSSKPVYISIRENTRLLTPTFLQALAVAFSLHVFAVILFHVQPFRINQANTQFPPVQVNIEIALPESAIFAELKDANSHQIAVPEPDWPKPSIPYLSLNSPNHLEIFTSGEIMPMDPFHLDFHEQLIGSWIKMDPAPIAQRKVPLLEIRGPLASRPVVAGTLPELSTPKKNGKSIRLVYSVKVDDESGHVFWYFPKTHPLDKKVEDDAVAILEALKFEPVSEGFVTQGEIELVLAGGKQ